MKFNFQFSPFMVMMWTILVVFLHPVLRGENKIVADIGASSNMEPQCKIPR